VPDSAIALEDEGVTTSESMHAVAEIMRTRRQLRRVYGTAGTATGSAHDPPSPPVAPSVILVSDPFHMLRLSIVARRLGLAARMSPTRTSPISASPSQQWAHVLGESVKVPAAWLLERSMGR
jgi:uncharacterized SAM-binding protein YcdF (DUF218 family)